MNQSKSRKNHDLNGFPRLQTEKHKMDEINWCNEFYSHLFSLRFDNLLQSLNLDSMEAVVNQENESSNTVEVASEQGNERVPLAEKQNEDVPDESRFPLTANELINETLQAAENKNTKRSTSTWMNVGPSGQSHET